METGYQPEADSSPELDHNGITTFQELIAIFWWEIEIGRIDVF